ncbi:MAG: hypothetical protein EXX96DRAFT_112808 [Benjaminiella poitrasii]|nr:MAG: hypothetical protein EXX96DRAFT_112808 [Benjaminiella poitrasii]
MYFSLAYASYITHLCMDEIRRRGFNERKLFLKTVPHNGLFTKVFTYKRCTSEDLSYIHVHTVATLMQEALFSCNERIIPKKIWTLINYETCTMSKLSTVITSDSQILLMEILDFLVELLRHREKNAMDPFKLGDALGKAILGHPDCSPITAVKAGHFLSRLIIEYSKMKSDQHSHYSLSSYHNKDISFEDRALSKSEAARARVKSYNRSVVRVKNVKNDWLDNMENVDLFEDYDEDLIGPPEPPEKPWISIFTSADNLLNHPARPQPYYGSSPLLYRILKEAVKTPPNNSLSKSPADPFASSYLFSKSRAFSTERQLQSAFNDFRIIALNNNWTPVRSLEKKSRKPILRKLNHAISQARLKQSISPLRMKQSISQMRLTHPISNSKLNDSILSIKSNLRKYRSRSNLQDFSSIISNSIGVPTTITTTNTDDLTILDDVISHTSEEDDTASSCDSINKLEPSLTKRNSLGVSTLLDDASESSEKKILSLLLKKDKPKAPTYADNEVQPKSLSKGRIRNVVRRMIKRTASRASQSHLVMGSRSSNKVLCVNE